MGINGALPAVLTDFNAGMIDGEVHEPEAGACPSCFCLLWGVEGKAERRRGVLFMASFEMDLKLQMTVFVATTE